MELGQISAAAAAPLPDLVDALSLENDCTGGCFGNTVIGGDAGKTKSRLATDADAILRLVPLGAVGCALLKRSLERPCTLGDPSGSAFLLFVEHCADGKGFQETRDCLVQVLKVGGLVQCFGRNTDELRTGDEL